VASACDEDSLHFLRERAGLPTFLWFESDRESAAL
jgi:hypothetical protein